MHSPSVNSQVHIRIEYYFRYQKMGFDDCDNHSDKSPLIIVVDFSPQIWMQEYTYEEPTRAKNLMSDDRSITGGGGGDDDNRMQTY